MSFILDALRKSEHERRIDAAPDIMHMPHALPRTRLPTWAGAAIGALSAALLAVVLYVVLGQPGTTAPRGPAAAAAPSQPDSRPAQSLEPAPLSGPAAAQIRAPVRTANDPARSSTSGADELRNAPDAAAPASPEEIVAAGPASVPAPDSPPAGAAERLPSYAAIVAEGVSLGPLQMQLHVHSANAANRFVVINGSRYGQGEQLAEGPVIEEIAAAGAVLNFRGRRFFLTPN